MDTKRLCPVCGKPLAPNAPEGLCPECLLKAGLVTGADIGPDSVGQAPRFVPPKTEELAAKFPQLEILEFIGQGGMGAVYRARQKQLDRVVALKILPPQAGGPAFAERFTREARALAKLNHPHIVTLYEFGQSDGLFYFLMEFVDGVNLRQLLTNSRVSPREALAIVPQICEALQFAHDSGIVHRDIKPENILLDKKGHVKIADFGVAKMIAESLTADAAQTAATAGELTEAGSTLGTPQYMAPEQIKNPAEVDHRADIYSLGVVFYQMLTGELPSGKIEPPSRKVRIDVRLDEVVLRALEKNPELRFQRAGEVKTVVETIATTPQSAPTETSPGFKHYKNSEWNFELDIPEDWNTFPPNRRNSPYEVLRFGSHGNGRHLLIVFVMSSDIFPFKVSLKDLPDRLQKTLTRDMSAWAQKLLAKAGFGNFISGETIIGGQLVRTLDFDRPEGDGTWSCREYFIAEGKLAYVLGFGTTDKDHMFENFDRMAKSFQFGPPADENAGLPTFATSARREHLKPFFPKMETGEGDRTKPAPGGEQAEPGFTVRTEPLSPEPAAGRRGEAQPKKSGMVRIVEILFDITFTSPLAIRLLNLSALGFLGSLGSLGFVSAAWHGCFGFFGLFGLFGLIGFAFIVEMFAVRAANQRRSLPRWAKWGPWYNGAIFLLAVLLVAVVLRAFFIAPYRAETDAAAPEIPRGSHFLVWELANHYAPGDLVAYRANGYNSLGRVAKVSAATLVINRNGQGNVEMQRRVVLGKVISVYWRARSTPVQVNVIFHCRVFEADAGLVDQLIPAAERLDGVQADTKSVFAQGMPIAQTYTAGNFEMITHGLKTDSQRAQVSPAIVHRLLNGITINPGLLVDLTNAVSNIWWQPGFLDGWAFAFNHIPSGGGSAIAYFGVRNGNGGTDVRIDADLSFQFNVNNVNSRILYEGPMPRTNELVFLVPFLHRDGSAHYLVTIFDFNGQSNEEEASLNATAALPQFQFTAGDLASPADVATNQSGSIVVRFHLADPKAGAFQAFTAAHVNQQVEMMFGSRVLSKPMIRDVISNGEIEQSFPLSPAHALADLLNGTEPRP